MRPLLLALFCLVWALPLSAGLFDAPAPRAELGASLNNSADFLPVRQAFQLHLVEQTPERARLRFVIAEGYYLYRHRLQFSSNDAAVTVDAGELPAGLAKTDEYFGEVSIYRGVLDVELRLNNPKQQAFQLSVSYQGCADKGLCYPPERESFALASISASPTDLASPVSPSAQEGAVSWQGLLLFFLAGLGLTFTPCVLPMLPILSGVVLRDQPNGRRSLALSLAYVLPMALCFALLGTLTGLFGAELNLQARLQSPWVLVPFALLFGLFALAMFGLFELRLPSWLSEPLDRLSRRAKGGSLMGAALMGVLSSLLVSPCVSAPLAGVLLYISSSGDALGGGLKLFALGLGMGAPLLLLAAGGGALLPKTGAWMLVVRNVFGVLLLAVAIWMLERLLPGPLSLLLWGALAVGVALFLGTLELRAKSNRQRLSQLLGLLLLVYGLSCWVGALQGQSDPLRPLAAQSESSAPVMDSQANRWLTLSTEAELLAQQQSARAAGQPLLLDWYADWCVSCKVIEREVLTHPQVIPRLKNYRLIRLDVTQNTAEQRALLNHFKVFGPPAILFFNQQGQEITAARILGEIDRAGFLRQIDKAEQQGISPANPQASTAITL